MQIGRVQAAGLADDLEGTAVEEFRQWLEGMDENVADLRRKVGVSDRSILSKKQLIGANKAHYTRVCPHAGCTEWHCHRICLSNRQHDQPCSSGSGAVDDFFCFLSACFCKHLDFLLNEASLVFLLGHSAVPSMHLG